MTTVNNFFDLNNPSNKWVSKVEETSEFKKLKEEIQKELKGRRLPPAFYELLIRELTEPLGKDVSDVLVEGWKKRQEIQQYRDREKYPNETGYVVTLIDHSLTSKHTYTITPVIYNVRLRKLKFDLLLKLNLKGAVLKIREAKIRNIRAGSFTGSGEIKFKGVTIAKRETDSITIPLQRDFEEPIPI